MRRNVNRLDWLCVRVAALSAHPWADRYRRARRAAHGWMFATGTRAIELLNVLALAVWAAALLDDRLLTVSVYLGVSLLQHPWANEALAVLFCLAAIVALAGLLRTGPPSDKLASFALQAGSVAWFGVALNFMATYPPLNTGVGTYGVLAFLTWSAGCYLQDD